MTDAPLTHLDEQEVAELRYLFAVMQSKTGREEYNLAACRGKHRFETRNQAVSTIAWAKRHEIHAYHCPDCKKWHIGGRENVSRAKRAKKRILQRRREDTCE